MIFLVQFGINVHLYIFFKTTNCTRPMGSYNFVFEKIYSCLFIPNFTRNHVINYTKQMNGNMESICQVDNVFKK